jgi:di/tricarboxylate transporter
MAFALIAGAIIMFAWGRFRYDLIALVTLLLGVLLGVVPAQKAFNGFKSDVVVIIATALIVSAAIARSGVVERVLQPILPRLRTAQSQVPVLVAATTLLSMVSKNVGALAIFMPVALQLARRTGTSASCLLMPMSFGSLLGGLVTLVGTSTNIIVSQVREQTLGQPFAMFDFAPVGLGLAVIGFVFLSFAYRLLPLRRGAAAVDEAIESQTYVTEAKVPESWQGTSVIDLDLGKTGVKITAIVRDGDRHVAALPDARLMPGDTVILEGEEADLELAIARAHLSLVQSDAPIATEGPEEQVSTLEAVIEQGSVLIGRSARRLDLRERYGVNLLAVRRSGERLTQRLRAITLRAGDVLVLQASEKAVPTIVRELGLLPLIQREIRLGESRRRLVPVAILTVAMTLVALKMLPVAIAFFGAAVAMVAIGGLPMRDAYDSMEGSVLVLIGALVPLSEAVHDLGGTQLIANGVAPVLSAAPPWAALALITLTSMLAAPFLHNAPTVLMLGPIAVSLAQRLNLNPDPFLMGVAVGAACDFLTPIGHQCNTLVMGPGGYRFTDYWKLGLPLSICVIALGTPLIANFWPLRLH